MRELRPARPNLVTGWGLVCAAFPDAIYIEGFDHRRPYRGDHGVRYVLASEDGAPERLAAYEATKRP